MRAPLRVTFLTHARRLAPLSLPHFRRTQAERRFPLSLLHLPGVRAVGALDAGGLALTSNIATSKKSCSGKRCAPTTLWRPSGSCGMG